MPRQKIESYLGFCKRAGKLTLGVNAVGTLKKGVYLLLIDAGTAHNSRKEMIGYKVKFSCPLYEAENLGAHVGKDGCKAAAVRDKSLAKAILDCAGQAGLKEIGGSNG